jgi:hypothetical protein
LKSNFPRNMYAMKAANKALILKVIYTSIIGLAQDWGTSDRH